MNKDLIKMYGNIPKSNIHWGGWQKMYISFIQIILWRPHKTFFKKMFT